MEEPPGGFCDVSCHFIFVFSFCCCCCCCSFVDVLHSHFIFNIIPHSSVDYHQVFTPVLYFLPAHCRVIRDTFIFNHSVIFVIQALQFWVGIFYPQAFFTLCSSQHFWHNLLLSRLPWEPTVIPWNLQGLILILKTQTQPICLFDSQ